MTTAPKIRFISLFVRDLKAATERYERLLGLRPAPARAEVPDAHPFSGAPPVCFDLGGVQLALYACDDDTTHEGDVALGLATDDPLETLTDRARAGGARVFYGPAPLAETGRQLAIFMQPDRHFFEVVGSTLHAVRSAQPSSARKDR